VADRPMTADEWDAIQRGESAWVYRHNTCPVCGRTISEGAYSGHSGNIRRHLRACEAAKAADEQEGKR
jgi:hypothetical protein